MALTVDEHETTLKTAFPNKLNGMLCYLLALALTVTSISAAAGETVRYIHTDAQGTPIVATDQNGNVIKRYEYEPYGLQIGGPVADGPGYTGHVEDAATGLTYMQQRYYDPGLGMFLSVDPMTAYSNPVGQFNRYRYANGNPYKYTDPDGRCAAVVVCAGVITLGVITIAAYIHGVQGTQKALENADHVLNNENSGENAQDEDYSSTDDYVEDMTDGATPEFDERGRERRGQYVQSEGSASEWKDKAPGEDRGSHVETEDGSRVSTHESTGTSGGRPGPNSGSHTVEVQRPDGKQNVKVRFPDP